MTRRVDLILPVLDEREALSWVLSRVPSGVDVIVVDNGSTDGSADLAGALGARVIVESRRGFGAACAAGLAASDAEIVAFCDADASLDPAQLPLVVDPVARGRVDLMIGSRIGAPWRVWPLHARLANRVLAQRIRRHTGARLSDPGPMRAMRRSELVSLDLVDRRFGWPLEMILRAAAAGWRISEVPVMYRPRVGRSKVTGTVRGTARALRDMRAVLADTRTRDARPQDRSGSSTSR